MDHDPILGRRRGPRWSRVAYGLHRATEDARAHADLRAWQLVLPEQGRFTHLTGAAVHGWPILPLPDGIPVLAAMDRSESRPQRPGIRVFRRRNISDAATRDGLRVDDPAEVLLACARHLGLLDLVVLTDAALHAGSCTRADLEELASQRRRGAPRLRAALGLADGRADSVWETLLRVLHVSCEVDVVPQHELRDEAGELVALADLWVRGTEALHEYDGEVHLSRQQQRKDLARARRIGNRTWVRRGYTSAEVLHQGVGILRDADLSLGRTHQPERIRAWHRLLVDSVFTPSGRTRLLERLAPTGGESGSDRATSGGGRSPGITGDGRQPRSA
jgi:hypothetical protein